MRTRISSDPFSRRGYYAPSFATAPLILGIEILLWKEGIQIATHFIVGTDEQTSDNRQETKREKITSEGSR